MKDLAEVGGKTLPWARCITNCLQKEYWYLMVSQLLLRLSGAL